MRNFGKNLFIYTAKNKNGKKVKARLMTNRKEFWKKWRAREDSNSRPPDS
jgi:hypothetical protein